MDDDEAMALGARKVSGEDRPHRNSPLEKPDDDSRPAPPSAGGNKPTADLPVTDDERLNRNNPKWWVEQLEAVENQYMLPDWPQIERRLQAAGADGITMEMMQEWYMRKSSPNGR